MSTASTSFSTWTGCLLEVPRFLQGDVERWADEKAAIPRRKQNKGYEKWLEGFIHEIQVKDLGDVCSVRALSYRSMAKNEKPYKVQATLGKGGHLTVEWSHCDCKAGSARCSHLVALLYNLAHFMKLGLKAVPPVVSKTSKPQQWHLPARTMGIHPQSVHTLTVSKVKPMAKRQRTGKKRVAEGVMPTLYCPVQPAIPWQEISAQLGFALKACDSGEKVRQILWLLPDASASTVPTEGCGSVPKGSVLAMQQPREEKGDIIFDYDAPDFPSLVCSTVENYYSCALPKALMEMYISLKFDEDTCVEIEKKTRLQSKSPLWKSVRQRRITASNFHRVHVRRADPVKLAASLTCNKQVMTRGMQHGLTQEHEAARLYANTTGNNVYQAGFVVNVNAPHIGASPDRKVFDGSTMPPFGLLEIKCPVCESYTEARCLKGGPDGAYKLKETHQYYDQVMGQMAVTGLTWCDFFVFCKNDFHLERIHFDPCHWEKIKMKLDKFFFEYFLPRLIE